MNVRKSIETSGGASQYLDSLNFLGDHSIPKSLAATLL